MSTPKLFIIVTVLGIPSGAAATIWHVPLPPFLIIALFSYIAGVFIGESSK